VDRSVLAARIQDILKGRRDPARAEPAQDAKVGDRARDDSHQDSGGAGLQPCLESDEEAAFAARCAADEAASRVRDVLDGQIVEGSGGRCLVVDRNYRASHVHGRHAVVRYAGATAAASHALPWFLGNSRDRAPAEDLQMALVPADPDPPRLLFFDLETTGLSGGAGTYAFLVGFGWFDGDAFLTRQFFLRGFGEERALLEGVRAFVQPGEGAAPPCLVTYNGRAFDLPLIETRYLFHRRGSPFGALPHVDMLFAARRLWRRRATRDAPAGSIVDRAGFTSADDLRASCALTALEQDILGLEREDDVPGWEIPARYFTYTRTGDAAGLAAVFEHNRLDLLSLGAVTGLILEMVVEQERVVQDRHGSLALARLLEHLGRVADAERSYERAASPDGLAEGRLDRLVRAEALHWLAVHRRRGRRFAEAAEAWRSLLQVPGLDAELRREACEALAIHHEHRAKDIETARGFALSALQLSADSRRVDDVRHRLNRLSRKLGGRRPGDAHLAQGTLPADDGEGRL
jgi:uncharacterized protein